MRINALYVIIKLVERCNLNCSYCYYYTPENAEVLERQSLMSEEHLDGLIDYVEAALDQVTMRRVVFGFHGGEPTLAKTPRVREFCSKARERLGPKAEVAFALQTNGVHISDDWMKLIVDERIGVGISIDGDKQAHDQYRVDHRGRGSYDRVCSTLEKLLPLDATGHIRVTALAVMGDDFAGLDFYRHLVDTLGIRHLKLLFLDRTSDMVPTDQELQNLGRTLCEIFDHWLLHDRGRVEVEFFDTVVRRILAVNHQRDLMRDQVTIGFALLSDGRVRIQDDFMIASEWFWAQRDLHVSKSRFADYLDQPHLQQLVHELIEAPEECRGCPYIDSCAGGEVAHRFTRERGFDSKSVYCQALKMFHAHVDQRLCSGAQLAIASGRVPEPAFG
ncbi:MAG: radical SAM protein [Lysobacter sp.]